MVASAITLSLAAREGTAATPSCGAVVTGNVVFDADLVCPDSFTGTALSLNAPGITVDKRGFKIVVPQGTGVGGTSNGDSAEPLKKGQGSDLAVRHSCSLSSNTQPGCDGMQESA